MDEVDAVTEDLLAASLRLLGKGGRLTTALPGFTPREAQQQLAKAIAQAIDSRSTLVAEAGTGTGKTYAYLIPCLQSGKKTIISTATKTLQDQLFQKDLPALVRALGLSTSIQNLKGRANYLCRYRIQLHLNEGRFIDPKSADELAHIHDKLAKITFGECRELPEISEDSPVWPYATSTADNCLGAECPEYQACYVVKARRRALKADVVVINHHLFFADTRLQQEGFGELLPGADIVVFDEAHQLADIATNFYGERLSTKQIRDLVDDILREWPVLDLANQPLKLLSLQLDAALDELKSCVPQKDDRVSWDAICKKAPFHPAWQAIQELCEDIQSCFAEVPLSELPGLKRCEERLITCLDLLQQFVDDKAGRIRWVERFKQTVVFHATPFDVADAFQAIRQRKNSAYIFTSATLTAASSFDSFTKPLGLIDVETLELASPFNFKEQALLYLPRSLPDPKDASYYPKLVERVLPLVNACGGRCFFLFTSHRALKQVANLLANRINYPLLIQGEESKAILLARFRTLGNAVLLGTATFWEGVDVKGDALSCVIIDKLPFASPADPVMQGKLAYIERQGLSSFHTVTLPNAILALKQGVGRLIRDEDDKGVLVIADPRLTARDYAKPIFSSLPKLPKTRDEQTVLTYINQLALTHEPVGN